MLRGYEMDQPPNVKPGALVILDSLNHPRHKLAVLDLAHIVERLPRGRHKVIGIDGYMLICYDVLDATHCWKLSRGPLLFRYVGQGELRSVCPKFGDSNRLGRLVNRRVVAVCKSHVQIKRIGQVWITLQTRVSTQDGTQSIREQHCRIRSSFLVRQRCQKGMAPSKTLSHKTYNMLICVPDT